jgi:membrane peptidoglycan carboxypeptidase
MIKVRNGKIILLFVFILMVQILTACTDVNAEDIEKISLEENNTKTIVLDKNGIPLTDDYILKLCNEATKNKKEITSEIKTTIDLNLQQEVVKEIDKITNITL